MAQTYSVEAVLSATDNGFSKVFGGAEKSVKGLNSEIPGVGGKTNALQSKMVGLGKAVIGAFAVREVFEFGKAITQAAATSQALESQFGQVFGDVKDEATGALDEIASETNILPSRLKPAFVQMAAFAKTTGVDTASALELTERATLAAADGAAFYDKSIEEVTDTMQSFLKGNYENDAALGISATETTRNAKANELYGQSFNELSEAQKQLTLLAMVEEGNKLSGALGQAAREGKSYENVLGNMKEAWKLFSVELGKPILPLVIKGMEFLTKVLQKATTGFQSLSQWASDLWSKLTTGDGVINGLITGLQDIWYELTQAFGEKNYAKIGALAGELIPYIIKTLIGGLPRLLQMGSNLINNISEGMGISVPELFQMAVTILSNFVTSFISGLPMIIQTGMQVLQGLISGIVTALPQILSAVSSIINVLVTTFTTYLPTILNMGIELLMMLINGVITMLPTLIPMVMDIVNMIVDTIVANLDLILKAGIKILKSLIDGIIDILPSLIDTAIQLLNSIVDTIVQNLPVIIDAGMEILMSLVDGIVEMLPVLIDSGIELILALFDALIDNLPTILDAGKKILLAVVDGILEIMPDLWDAAGEIVDAVWDTIKETDWWSIGSDIIAGIGRGISSAAGSLWEIAKGVLGSFKDNVLSFFGIHSPSRWMRDMVGINLTEGIGVGIGRGEGSLLRTANTMSSNLAEAIQAPTVDIDGQIARSRGQISSAINHSVNMNAGGQPAEINLTLGGRSFRAFVENISNAQSQSVRFEESYGI